MPFSLQNCCTDLPLRSCSATCSCQYALRSSTVLPVPLLVMSPICDRRAGFGRGVHEPLTVVSHLRLLSTDSLKWAVWAVLVENNRWRLRRMLGRPFLYMLQN